MRVFLDILLILELEKKVEGYSIFKWKTRDHRVFNYLLVDKFGGRCFPSQFYTVPTDISLLPHPLRCVVSLLS